VVMAAAVRSKRFGIFRYWNRTDAGL